jgi:guanylate kinase
MAIHHELTAGDRARALERAVEERRARAATLAALRRGTADPVASLGRRDRTWRRIPVRLYLRALRGVGPATADRAMRDLRIAGNRRMGGLGARQRERLAAWVSDRTGGGADARD